MKEGAGSERGDALRIGVVGLGVGASSLLNAIATSPFSILSAGADIDPAVLGRFKGAYPHAATFSDAVALCRSNDVDAVWIATPTYLHAEQAILAASCGKHVIVSKPLATTVEEGLRMLEAADREGVLLMAGHSLGFSPAIRRMAEIAGPGGRIGAVKAVQMMSFTDWLLLPRNAVELDASRGGGLTDRQSPHQIDAARLLGGGMVESVSGYSAGWMPERQIPGYYAAFLRFADGGVATISHNGHGYLSGAELPSWGHDTGISGLDLAGRNRSRERIRRGEGEEALKHEMRLGGSQPLFGTSTQRKPWLPMHLGLTVVSCERGEMRHSPYGVFVYSDQGREDVGITDDETWFGTTEIEELHHAVRRGEPLVRDGAWGLATLEVTCALKESSLLGREVRPRYQVPVRHARPHEPEVLNI